MGFTCHLDRDVAGSWDATQEVRSAEARSFAMQNCTNAWRDLIVTLTKRE